MIRILMGKAKSGKTYTTYEEIKRAGSKSAVLLIVPEQFTLEAEKQLMAHLKVNGIMNIEVLSFKRLIYHIFNEIEMPPNKEISHLGRSMLIKRVLKAHSAELKYYQSTCEKKGFLNQFSDFVDEMKHGMISFDPILPQFETHSILYLKLHDLNLLMKAYENAKKETYLDSADTVFYAVDLMKHSQKLKDAMIWVDGFDSFSKVEYQIISELALYSKTFTITVTHDGSPSDGVFNHTEMLIRQLESMGQLHEKEVKKHLLSRNEMKASMDHLSENLLTFPYKVLKSEDQAVKLHVANQQFSEVEHCIISIIELYKTKGYRWQDIAVVTNDLSGYEFIIKQLFDEYEIPYFFDQKLNIMSNPLIHLIINGLQIINHRFKREHVMSFLKTGLFNLEINEMSYFENYIIEFGIQGSHYFKPFEKNFKKDKAYDLVRINQVRVYILEILAPLLVFEKAKMNPVNAYLSAIFNLMQQSLIHESIQNKIDAFNQRGLIDEAQYFSQIWNAVLETFDQLSELMGEEMMPLETLVELLEIGFEATEIGLLPQFENVVLIGSLDRSRSHPIKALFILGVNDGVLPEAGGNQQLMEEQEKALIKSMGFDMLLDGKMFTEKETFNIYNAITRPSELLTFSYALTAPEGAVLRPSYLIQRLKKILPSIKISFETVDHAIKNPSDFPEVLSSSKGAVKHLAAEMRRQADGFQTHPCWAQAFIWYLENKPKLAQLLLDAISHDNRIDRIDRKEVLALYELPLKTSVSRLEQFMWCPFKHFVNYGLKPYELKTYEIGFPDVGTLFHHALELFGRIVYEDNIIWEEMNQRECEDLIEQIVDQMVDQDVFKSKFQYQYLIQKLKRVSKRAIWTLTKQLKQGEFVPTAFEMAFSDEGFGPPPMIIELPSKEKLMIRGVIDRVDILSLNNEKYVKIIDYKSGNTTLSFSDIYHGLQMQLLVYLEACLKNPDYFRAEEIKPGGIFYFKIDDPMIQSAEHLADLIEAQIEQQLRLDGIVLEDQMVIEKIDRQLMENSKSTVLKVGYKKDGAFTKDSKVVPLEGFYQMIDHVKGKIGEIGMSLLDGVITASPCQTEGRVACQFCDYQSLCQFDVKFEGNSYRKLPKMNQEEVITAIKSKAEVPHDAMD